MSKVFQSSSISKILSTNQLNTIEVNNDNIIESDSEFREVIKKGYLLTQINLSTIPDIIQDAIDKAILDAKTQTLADSLISTLRQSIENFDDGVYKKTYIDQTITYLEELLIQKASPEIVASIAEAKIAVATVEFASASQVGILSSRVGSSESEIINIKETINTKDVARATQIEELQASLNQTLANYSEAIDLTVDAEGNVKAQKIETLSTNIGLQLQEVNQLIVNTNNEWNAKSIKLITSPSGAITGYSFQNGSGVKSNFDINADNFKISNSYNTYSPFSIVGTSLYFNGKISFTNTTNVPNFVLTNTLNTELAAVNTNITNAINNLTKVEDISWQQEVQDAINNNATYIDGGKIVATDMFINNINAKGGIIADSVRANTIIGNDIYGSKIEGVNIIGARINGAVIKASYLDLDGELEVLTNYHITLAMFNSNPSLYTDAVFISADNEYRIPSMSIVSEPANQVSGTVGYSALYGKIMSYNNANSGTNIKAVKIRPTFNIISPINLAIGTINSTVNISLGSHHLLRVIVDDLIANNHYSSSITANCYSSYWGTDEIRVREDGSTSLSITGVPIFDFLVNISIVDGIRKFIISSNPKVSTIPFDWTSGSLVIESTGEIVTKTLGPQIQINNMI